MKLQESLENQGEILFRNRGFIPLLFVAFSIPVSYYNSYELMTSNTIVECIRKQTYLVKYPYIQMGAVMNILKRSGVIPEKTNFQLTCSLEASI